MTEKPNNPKDNIEQMLAEMERLKKEPTESLVETAKEVIDKKKYTVASISLNLKVTRQAAYRLKDRMVLMKSYLKKDDQIANKP